MWLDASRMLFRSLLFVFTFHKYRLWLLHPVYKLYKCSKRLSLDKKIPLLELTCLTPIHLAIPPNAKSADQNFEKPILFM